MNHSSDPRADRKSTAAKAVVTVYAVAVMDISLSGFHYIY